jgi:hypothetical protein
MRKAIAMLLALVSGSSIAAAEYTLYRSGIDVAARKRDEALRIHIATFDAAPLKDVIDNDKYNRANCDFAQAFFNDNQPHFQGSSISDIKIKYWCEKGRFRK